MFVVKIETTKDVYSDMLKQKEFFDNVKLCKNKTYADFYVNLGSMNLNPSDSDIRKEFNNTLGKMRKRPKIIEIKPFEIKEDEIKEGKEKKGDKDIVRGEKEGVKEKEEEEVKEEEEKKSVFIIRQLKSKISNLESRLKTANKKIDEKDREIENYKKENTRIFDQLITAQNTIGKLKTELGNERLRFNMANKNREKKILLTNKEDWNTVFPEEDMDKACSICYENKKSHVFSCGHSFCGKCVKESVLDQDKNKCPLCQVEINSIIRILDYYD